MLATDENTIKKPPKLIVISGFSGVGKGSTVEKLMEMNQDIFLSISDTDRAKRNSIDQYHFITTEKFRKNLKCGYYMESNKYGSNSYGSPRSPIINKLKAGHDVILEIDIHGLRQVCQDIDLKRLGVEIVSIFIACDFKTLIDRLRGRGTSEKEIIERVRIASEESKSIREYDYVLVNHEVKKTAEAIQHIIFGCSVEIEGFNSEEFQKDVKRYLEVARKHGD